MRPTSLFQLPPRSRLLRPALLPALGLLVLTQGCPPPNNPPEVLSLEAEDTTVDAGRRVEVSVEAEDPDGDELTYIWETDNCRIDYEQGSRPEEETTVWFRALPDVSGGEFPCRNGLATVRVTVVDPEGLEDTDSLEIDVIID